jgi:hypothetical protein
MKVSDGREGKGEGRKGYYYGMVTSALPAVVRLKGV